MKYSGVLLSQHYDGGREKEFGLLQCCHCSYTWLPQPGSGTKRGFCQNCMGYVCGHAACAARGCLHREKWLDLYEKDLLDAPPASASVPSLSGIILGRG